MLITLVISLLLLQGILGTPIAQCSQDDIYHILSFLDSPRDIQAFGSTNLQIRQSVYSSPAQVVRLVESIADRFMDRPSLIVLSDILTDVNDQPVSEHSKVLWELRRWIQCRPRDFQLQFWELLLRRATITQWPYLHRLFIRRHRSDLVQVLADIQPHWSQFSLFHGTDEAGTYFLSYIQTHCNAITDTALIEPMLHASPVVFHFPALMSAIGCANLNLVRLLLDYGVDVNGNDEVARQPLGMVLAMGGDSSILHLLLRRNALTRGAVWTSQVQFMQYRIPPLVLAALLDDKYQATRVVQVLVSYGAGVGELMVTVGGKLSMDALWSPIYFARSARTVKALLEFGSRVDTFFMEGYLTRTDPPLDFNLIVRLLVDHLLKLDKDGVVGVCIQFGSVELVEYLLDTGNSVDFHDLVRVPQVRYLEDKASMLKLRGVDPNVLNSEGRPPLFYAIRRKNVAMVDVLLSVGADPYAGGYKRRSLMQEAFRLATDGLGQYIYSLLNRRLGNNNTQ
jgi:hypothetical protein